MNIIEVRDLCYTYDDELALDHLTMAFAKGKTTAVLGGNGAGKSTLFLNLNGVLTPKSGRVFFEGREINYNKKELQELRKKVGIVFQDPDDQLFSASVVKDISFGPMKLGLPEDEVRRRVGAVVRQTGIESLVGKPTHALSFGQKKRVAIAGVLAMQPSLIILDEPTAGLDPQSVSEILTLLQEIKETMGISVILSTHEIDLVPLYCDDVFILDKGAVAFSGTPEALFSQPGVLRAHSLRLPRITHLMNILYDKDRLKVDRSASTISRARKTIKELLCDRSATADDMRPET